MSFNHVMSARLTTNLRIYCHLKLVYDPQASLMACNFWVTFLKLNNFWATFDKNWRLLSNVLQIFGQFLLTLLAKIRTLKTIADSCIDRYDKFLADILPIYHRYTTDISPIYHRYTDDISAIYHRYITDILPIYHRYTTDILTIYHRYTTDISPIYCRYTTDISPIYHRYTADMPRSVTWPT